MGILLQDSPIVTDAHCSAEEIAAFIDNGLSEPQRRDVEAHFARCAACRAELIAARDLVGSRQAVAQGRRFGSPLWLLAAAAVVAMVLIPMSRGERPFDAESTTMRSSGIDGASLRSISPREESLTPGDGRFVWSDAGDAMYRVVVTDSSGASIWTATTRDTSALLPASAGLVRGHRYYWSVDALKTDGSSYTSGVVAFSVRE